MSSTRRRSSAAATADVAQVHIRRAYADGRQGQLHLTTAYPSGGGFDERTPLVCLHPEGASGAWFKALLPDLGRDRSVYAPDLAAHGYSDPAPGTALGLADHVAAIGDLFDTMRLRSADLFGHGLGAAIAAELAAQRPQQVRRVVLAAMPDLPGSAAQVAATRDSQPVARSAAARLSAITQQALLLYPVDAPADVKRLVPARAQHSVVAIAHPTAQAYGPQAAELVKALRSFLDR